MAEFRLNTGERISVDPDIALQIAGQSWRKEGQTSVRRSCRINGKVVTQMLAEFIMGESPPRGYIWGHKNKEWRDFRRENLVHVQKGHWLAGDPELRRERAINSQPTGASKGGRNNRSNALGWCGVYKISENSYRALARVDGKQKYLGSSKTAEGAAKLYDEALVAQGLPPVNFPHGGADKATELAEERKAKLAMLEKLRSQVEALERELGIT